MTPALLDTSKLIVGASGSGKTVTAKDEVGQLLLEKRHVAIIDPTGVWWGMRSSVNGRTGGFALPIFGGQHGDIAIRPDMGAAIAGILLAERTSAIVDLSAIDNSRDWRLFMADFVAELRRGVAGNFHLVVDEADEFAAERAVDDIGFALRENLVWIAKRGRAQGFVPTWITQRTAEIAKAVISQAQTIVAHQLVAPSDRKAIDDYLKGNGSAEARRAVMESLAELQVGERWIYSPRLKLLERGLTPPLTTFDSSRTPAPGETIAEPRTLADLDVSAIAAALQGPADAHPADRIPKDPRAAYEKGSEIGALLDEREERIAQLEATVADQAAEIEHLRIVDFAFDRQIDGLAAIEQLVNAVARGKPWPKLHSHDADLQDETAAAPSGREARAAQGVSAPAADLGFPPPADTPANGSNLAPRLQDIVDWTHWSTVMFGDRPVRRDILAMLIGTHVRTKGFLNNLGELRTSGIIDYADGGGIVLTSQGLSLARKAPAPATPAGLREQIWKILTPAQRRLIDQVVAVYPAAIARMDLAASVGKHVRTKGFLNNLGRLRSLGLVEYPSDGGVRVERFLMRSRS